MTRRAAALILALCLCLTVVPGGAAAAGNGPFTDVPSSHWASEAVTYVYENGLMNGVGEETFQPSGSLTRAMFVTILGRMAGVAEGDYPGTSFTDVPAGQWYSPYVAWAAQAGVAGGTGGGKFSPDSAVTREQMATMIARYTESAGLTLNEVSDPAPSFTDQGAVASWAREGVDLMRRTGILTGYEDGSFQPQRTANRAEAAAIFMRLDEGLTVEEQDPETIAVKNYETIAETVKELEQDYVDADGLVSQANLPLVLSAVADYAQDLERTGTISDYEVSDSCVYMNVGGWLGFLYVPNQEGMMAGGQDAVEIVTLEPFPGEMYPAYLLAGMKGPDEAAEQIVDAFGGAVNYDRNLDGDEVSVETLRQLPQNSILLWSGHGAYVDSLGSVLFLGTKQWDQATILLYAQEFGDQALLVNQNGQFYISPVFFEQYMPEDAFAGSMVYLGACESFMDQRLAQSIWDKGAQIILGNTRSVRQIYNFQMMYSFVQAWAQPGETGEYATVSQALAAAKEQHGATDSTILGYGSEVLALYREDVTLEEFLAAQQEVDLSQLVGVYEGSYFATQGETGLTLTIYEEAGTYRALFEFYNLPGCTNSEEGSYTMLVGQTPQGTIRFLADQWLERPAGYMLLNLEGTLQGDVLSGQSPTPFSVTRVSQEVPEDPVQPAVNYDTFLREKGYRSYLGNWWCTPSEYALLDIDQDGTQELILQGEDGTGFYNHLIFRWDAAQGTAVVVPMDGTDQGFASYGGLTYAPKYQAINLSYPRYSYYDGSVDYYVLQDGALRRSFSVGWTTPSTERLYFWADANGQQQIISQEQYEAYKPENQNIDFQPLP